MKNAVIPFVREVQLHSAGPDVEAIKRALKKAGFGHGLSSSTTFGAQAVANLKAFQKAHKLVADGDYGAATHLAMTPYFDEFGASLLSKEAAALAKVTIRDSYVKALLWMLAHRSLFDYNEIRPIPLHLAPFETTSRIVTDCSGSTTLAAYWSKAPDPNGLGFNGQGYTGTMLNHCSHISVVDVKPGDLIVYGSGTGHHVVAVLEVLGGGDFLCFSHGQQGDPREIKHSDEGASQARNGHPGVTFCRFIS